MKSVDSISADKAVKRWMLLSIPILFILGGVTHFVYDWSGGDTIVGIFAPVNESVWEHLKMSFWIPLLWWVATYFILSKRYDISAASWFSACAAALYIAPLFITAFYYTYTGTLGFESVVVDILSLLIGIAVAQAAAFHIYKYGNFGESCLQYSVFAIAMLAAAFVIFTFKPPHVPLFMDPNTGEYGINIASGRS